MKTKPKTDLNLQTLIQARKDLADPAKGLTVDLNRPTMTNDRGAWPVPCVTCRRTPELSNDGPGVYWLTCRAIDCWRGPKRATQGEAARAWNGLMDTARKTPMALRQLSDSILVYLDAVDARIGPDRTIPRDASSALGKMTGLLEMTNDRIRHFVLKLGIAKADKTKALERLLAAQ